MKKLTAYALLVIAAVMAYLGITNGILPPTLTAVGFVLIAISFLSDKSERS